MNKTRSAFSISSLVLGISLASVCHANPAAKQNAPDSNERVPYSAAALYNLGNAYAQAGKPALAVLNYERARVLAPQNPDVKANLQRVRDSASAPGALNGIAEYFQLMSPNATYWFGLAGLIIAGISGLMIAHKKAPRIASIAALGGGLLIVAYALADAAATAPMMREGIVMQTASACASPIVSAETLFTLNSATLVQIQDEHGNFWLIRDSHNNVGWVPRSTVTPVINPEGDFHA